MTDEQWNDLRKLLLWLILSAALLLLPWMAWYARWVESFFQ